MIKICIPYYHDYYYAETFIEYIKEYGKIPFAVFSGQSALIPQARNALVNNDKSHEIYQVMDDEYSHVFFVDADVTPTLDGLIALLKMDTDIACLPYLRQQCDDQYTAFTLDEHGIIQSHYPKTETGVKEIDGCGAGAMLIRMPVFNRIKYPWFHNGLVEKNGLAQIISEDIIFCMKARTMGYKIMCDFNHPAYHAPRNNYFITQ